MISRALPTGHTSQSHTWNHETKTSFSGKRLNIFRESRESEREGKDAYRSDEFEVEFFGLEEHVGAGVPVEHELTLPVGA